MQTFIDRFPTDIPGIGPAPPDLPRDGLETMMITLKDPTKLPVTRVYPVPKKFVAPFQELIQVHLDAGRIHPSTAGHASPSFLVTKKDPNALPRMVIDYRTLNANVVRDRTPLPRADDVLDMCLAAKFWGILDMTNSFFQTRSHPSIRHLTAFTTPFGQFEWDVMPMGFCNSPAIHQRRMYTALGPLIGRICHVYLDDIIIWSQTLEEHKINVCKVLEALHKHDLYALPKKTKLFAKQVHFLGHRISCQGLSADPKKITKITKWPTPQSATDVRSFLGLVQYLRKFVKHLASFSAVLTPLTSKEAEAAPFVWTREHQAAFAGIKTVITSLPCLTTIDYNSSDPIYVTTDASGFGIGAILSQGPTWETSNPVAYESRQMIPAKQNYPTHEQELLAVVYALKKWRVHLLGVNFEVRTDHDTLKSLFKQKDLSRHQICWVEFLSEYDMTIIFVPGRLNGGADALSRYPFERDIELTVQHMNVHSITTITMDSKLIRQIWQGYRTNHYFIQFCNNLSSLPGARRVNRLLYTGDRLCIPDVPEVRAQLLLDAHEALGHFGSAKLAASMRASFFWPTMVKDCKQYVKTCDSCQRHKSTTQAPAGPLHSLPIPQQRFSHIAIDFVGPFVKSDNFDYMMTITCRLTGRVAVIPTVKTLDAKACARLFHHHWVRHFGLPSQIVSNRDKLFTSKFWRSLMKLMGIKQKMSTAFHPQTDGRSKVTNKTVIQSLCAHVDRRQAGWAAKCDLVEHNINSTVHQSTGKTPFELTLGFNPRLLPATSAVPFAEIDVPASVEFFQELQRDIDEARDAILTAQTRQAQQANKHRRAEVKYKVDDLVMRSTKNYRAQFKDSSKATTRSAKLMPRYDGPWKVLEARPETSTYVLDIPGSSAYSTYHGDQLKPYHANDEALFPGRTHTRPGPAIHVDGQDEKDVYTVDSIVDERWFHGKREFFI